MVGTSRYCGPFVPISVHCVPTGHRSRLQNPLQRGWRAGGEQRGGGQPGVDIHWIDVGSGRATAKSNSWFLYRLIFGERDSGRFQVGIAPCVTASLHTVPLLFSAPSFPTFPFRHFEHDCCRVFIALVTIVSIKRNASLSSNDGSMAEGIYQRVVIFKNWCNLIPSFRLIWNFLEMFLCLNVRV